MENKSQQTVTEPQAVVNTITNNTNASKILHIRKKPTIAPCGQNQGRIAAIQMEGDVTSEGKDERILRIIVDLYTVDSKDSPYRVEKIYKLGGRGIKAFCEDFKSVKGRAITDDELDAFNPEELMKDQNVTVEIKHRKDGKKIVPAIDKFLPVSSAVEVTA